MIIERNMNDLLIYIVEFVMDEFAMCREASDHCEPAVTVVRHQRDFGCILNAAYHISPNPFASARIYAHLYCLLRSRRKFTLSMPMEKLLAQLVSGAIHVNQDCYRCGFDGLYEIELEGEDRRCVLEALSRDREKSGHRKPPGRKIAEFETPDLFLDMCFWNMDCLLPEITRRHTGPIILAGVPPVYELPKKWWDDADGPAEDYADYNDGGVALDHFEDYLGY